MEFLEPLWGGVAQLSDVWIWGYVLVGTIIGVIGGGMPGIGTTLLYGMVLPFTFALDPVHAIAFLLSISVGVGYGNSIPAILMGIPGTPAAVLTVLDGHHMQKNGEGGLALATAFLASVIGQVISIFLFIILVVPLMELAYSFLFPELFCLYLLGILAIISLTGNNMLKGLIAAGFGLLVALVGLDSVNLTTRFTFDQMSLRSGFDTMPILIGLLAVSELFRSSRQVFYWSDRAGHADDSGQKFPKLKKLKPAIGATLSGTVLGTLVGAVPGAGATPAALLSYQLARILSKTPEKFGHGSLEGLAASDAAQNASNSGELIPTLALGVPGSTSMVLLLSALTVHGFAPGPMMIRQNPDLFYAAISGLLAASIVLLIVGWWMASLMLKAVALSRTIVLILSLATVVLGVYSINCKLLDLVVMFVAGGVGYLMLRYGYSTAAAALAFVLGGELERTFRLGLNLVDGSYLSFFTRPITMTILAITLGIIAIGVVRHVRIGAKRTSLGSPVIIEGERS
jgi:putative tricarboxylic transport membrane protein